MRIPSTTKKRLISAVPKFRKVLLQARERDINEASTVMIVTDILEEVFGYDRYSEIVREYEIKGRYCDIAIKTSRKIEYLIEVKAIGRELKAPHVRQAVTYASHEGVRWVVLTNGINWEVYIVELKDSVESAKVLSFDLTEINAQKTDDQETMFLLCKRGTKQDTIDEFYSYRQSINRFTIAAILLTEPVISSIRKGLKSIQKGLKVDNEKIEGLIREEVLKRDLVESETAKDVAKSIQRALNKRAREKSPPKTA